MFPDFFLFLLLVAICVPDGIESCKSKPKPSGLPAGYEEAYKDAGKLLTRSMDKSIKPCDNFYQFSCANPPEISLMRDANNRLATKIVPLLDNLVPKDHVFQAIKQAIGKTFEINSRVSSVPNACQKHGKSSPCKFRVFSYRMFS